VTEGPLAVYYEFQCSKHIISLTGTPLFKQAPMGWYINMNEMQCLVRKEDDDCQEWWEVIVVMHAHQP